MKRILLALALVSLCMGQICGLKPWPEPAVPDRLAVNGNLRTACAGYCETDKGIEGLISSYESLRLAGHSSVELEANLVFCYEPPHTPEQAKACVDCCTAVIRQVYGP